MNTYDIGDTPRLTATWTDINDLAVDPSAVTFTWKTPGASVTTYTYGVDAQLVKSSTGIYYVDLALNASGKWSYRFAGTGPGAASAENQLNVRESLVL